MPAPATPAILVSACLLGQAVRYDAQAVPCPSRQLADWQRAGLLLPFCPETAGGLPVPRPAAEIRGAGGGSAVLAGAAEVVDGHGRNLNAAFIAGAEAALAAARRHGIRLAILKERSPSCGSRQIYDGSFAGRHIAGAGVTAALLEAAGIRVFNEQRIAEAAAFYHALPAASAGAH
ncbi:uncharacterized protein YbbK (DUF523 family) [Azonexus fungiphilus]|uniref:Uncharacterized protein YbbK (DUF523 family) n=1 Tax=Azonexus fungiphilus TaxID=146940 RepID=A0A495WFZ4_9RHOO|nr:DUF523 domain-containing protein [Azonexus fungiphilus]RKT60611.1 uncharacterized protein YbbK (DUF523 family) [Azonexus fungiphilus]